MHQLSNAPSSHPHRLATHPSQTTMALPLEVSAPNDFDFIVGDWTVRHRCLNARLAGCTEWTEFAGRSSTRKTLGGFGNLEDNILDFPRTVPIARWRCVRTARKTSTWSIWWLDGRNPTQLDKPVVGRFLTKGKGLFFADDSLDEKPIKSPLHLALPPRPRPTLGAGLLGRQRCHVGNQLDDAVQSGAAVIPDPS